MTKLKGAPGHVLEEVTSGILCGRDERSYLDISVESGYSVPAVISAIRVLESAGYIRVIRQGPSKPNRYERLNDERRRLLIAARGVGLVL